jgi:hypothetical protein
MGKYSSGIGMKDVSEMMRAVEVMHACRVVYHVTVITRQPGGSMLIVCEATFDVLPNSELPKVVKVEMTWPNSAAATFDGLCYNLLWQLDYAIQKAYEQAKMVEK